MLLSKIHRLLSVQVMSVLVYSFVVMSKAWLLIHLKVPSITRVEGLVIANAHCFLDIVNCHSEHLVLIGLFPPLVVHGCITHLAICDNPVSAFTCQDEAPLQTSVVIDVWVDRRLSNDRRCVVLVAHECP